MSKKNKIKPQEYYISRGQDIFLWSLPFYRPSDFFFFKLKPVSYSHTTYRLTNGYLLLNFLRNFDFNQIGR